jgi:uncharacterized ferritin-like protein (DUF455 family)
MDWSPFVVCAPEEHAPASRGLGGPDGLGDRLRTAAFAERQAAEAFRWAADGFTEAPDGLRAAWKELAADENKHLGWILQRMKELRVELGARPVSDRLWRSLMRCRDHREFARLMTRAEERGKAAEESFRRSLAERDPVTADIFGRIAEEEERHIGLQRAYAEESK